MIITPNTAIPPKQTDLDSAWENERYACAWKGFVFIPGIQAGAPSVESAIGDLAEKTLPDALLSLKGIFFMAIRDKKRQETFVLTDHSGLFKAYFTGRLISTSYLELINHLGLRVSNLSPEAVVEFLHLGYIHFNRTLTPGIEKIRHDEILTFDASNSIQRIPKPLPALSEPPTYSLQDFFRKLADTIRHESLSVDLTGGFDSRLVVCLLASVGLDFEVSLSGTQTYRDLAIARDVAVALGKELQVTHHQVNCKPDYILSLFRQQDGLGDLLTFHRLKQYHGDRQKRGITLAISGAGGELYKDFWWLQDFPFYNASVPKLSRLYDLRIETLQFPHALFTSDFQELSSNFRLRMLDALTCYIHDSNTKTYDSIYYYFKMQETAGRFVTTTINHYVNTYIPLLDQDLVAIGYNLPRKQRFFNYFHRSFLHRLNPQIARIRTTEGVTASLAPMSFPIDICRYIGNKGKRVFKKIGQRLTDKTWFQDTPDNSDLTQTLLNQQLMNDMLHSLKNHNILIPTLRKEDVPRRYLGRILTLGLLLDELK